MDECPNCFVRWHVHVSRQSFPLQVVPVLLRHLSSQSPIDTRYSSQTHQPLGTSTSSHLIEEDPTNTDAETRTHQTRKSLREIPGAFQNFVEIETSDLGLQLKDLVFACQVRPRSQLLRRRHQQLVTKPFPSPDLLQEPHIAVEAPFFCPLVCVETRNSRTRDRLFEVGGAGRKEVILCTTPDLHPGPPQPQRVCSGCTGNGTYIRTFFG